MWALRLLVAVAGFFFATASDNFTRANNTTLGTNWSDPEAQWGINTNSATEKNVNVNAQAVAWWNPSTNSFGSNQFSQVTCGTVSGTPPYGGQQCGVGVEMTGASLAAFTGYVSFADAVGNTWALYRQDSGISYHSLASGSRTPTDGDVWYLEDNAGTLKLKVNGSTLATVSDSTYTSGQPGMNVYSNGSIDAIAFNTWSGGDLGGGGSVFPSGILVNPLKGCCR